MDPRVYLIRIMLFWTSNQKKSNTFVSCRMEYNLTYHIYIYSSSPLFLWPIYSFLRSFLEIIVMSRTQSYAHDNDVQTYKKKVWSAHELSSLLHTTNSMWNSIMYQKLWPKFGTSSNIMKDTFFRYSKHTQAIFYYI